MSSGLSPIIPQGHREYKMEVGWGFKKEVGERVVKDNSCLKYAPLLRVPCLNVSYWKAIPWSVMLCKLCSWPSKSKYPWEQFFIIRWKMCPCSSPYERELVPFTNNQRNMSPQTNQLSEHSVQFSLVSQACPTICDPMNRSTPGLPVHHQLPGPT